jgi:uncharacterized delta-60 repeat protein
VTTSFGTFDAGNAVVVQPDGKIIVGGEGATAFALARYNPDGTLDKTFDGDRRITTAIGFIATIHAFALQPDGKIIAAGTSNVNGEFDFTLTR